MRWRQRVAQNTTYTLLSRATIILRTRDLALTPPSLHNAGLFIFWHKLNRLTSCHSFNSSQFYIKKKQHTTKTLTHTVTAIVNKDAKWIPNHSQKCFQFCSAMITDPVINRCVKYASLFKNSSLNLNICEKYLNVNRSMEIFIFLVTIETSTLS